MAQKIKRLREDSELTLEAVSIDTGISKSTLSDIELNPYRTKFENIVILAEYYNVSVDYLLGLNVHPDTQHTEISELNLDSESVLKLKENTRRGKILSKLINLNCLDEFLDKLELFIRGDMRTTYMLFNTIYETDLLSLKKTNGETVAESDVLKVLSQAKFDDSIERYMIKEFMNKLLNELYEKSGNKVMENKSAHAPVAEMLKSAASSLNIQAENTARPTLNDFIKDKTNLSPEIINALSETIYKMGYKTKQV